MNLTLRRNLISRMGIEAFTMLAFMPVGVYAGSGSLVKGEHEATDRERDVFMGAEWIGTASDDIPLYPDYLSVFKIDFDIEVDAGGSAAILYGMNDPRLMNVDLNIYNIAAPRDESAIKIEFSHSGEIRVFRYGYHPADSKSKPLGVYQCGDVWGKSNHVSIASNLGHTDIFVNGKKVCYIGINPIGNGGDWLAFPVLAEMGVDISGNAVISNLKVRNFREPSNVLFADSAAHAVTGRINLPERSMPQLRTNIPVDGKRDVKSARIDVTARGIYDLKVNGKRVTEGYFYPGSTQYNKTHLFNTFDITPYLTEANNTLDVSMGEGWWSGPATFMGEMWNFYGDRQSLLACVTVEYTDGTVLCYPTLPSTWEYCADGANVVGSFFNGEIYDATRRASDMTWHPADRVGCDSTTYPFPVGWDNVVIRRDYGGKVVAADTLTAVSVVEPRKGVFIYDFGQNFAGVPLLRLSGQKRGTEVAMRYAEVLYPDMERYGANRGMIMTENIRAAMNRDVYVAAGEEEEYFSPRFTLHGFRYVEITGIDKPLPVEDVKAVALSSIDKFKASFECSDTLVNRLWKNILWSTRSNFISIPTDCPQRNERLGWMGDISVYAPTATKIADVSAILRQYLQSVRDCQTPEGKFPDVAPTGVGFGGFLWGSAGITVPYEHFLQYGDTTLVREHYPAMKRYMDYVFDKTIDPQTGVMVQDRAWGDLGDWLSPEYDKNDKSLLWECYLIYDLDIMTYLAKVVGNDTDAAFYKNKGDERREFFKKVYVDPATKKTRFSSFDPEREGRFVDTQASYALPIAMGIMDDPGFADNFIATITRENIADNGKVCPPYSLMTGFIGTAWIQEALSRIGRGDVAYRILANKEYPSWLYPVTQGATSVWERLDSYTHTDGFGANNSMNSFNHYSFGSVGNWLLTRCLGIKYDDNGITVAPDPDITGALSYANGELETPWGLVKSGWEIEGNKVRYEVEVPVESCFVAPDGTKHRLNIGKNRIILRK